MAISEDLFIDTLIEYGLTIEEISNLVNSRVLVRKNFDTYSITSAYGFYHFALKFDLEKKFDLRDHYFLKCYEEDPNYEDVAFRLFFRSICMRQPEEALGYMDNMLNSSNEFLVRDAKFYLYILSLIIELPDKYKKTVNNISYFNIAVNDNDTRYSDVFLQNRIRLALWQNRLSFVFTFGNGSYANATFYERNAYNLFSMLNNAYGKRTKKILEFVSSGKYSEAYEILLNDYNRRTLQNRDIYTMKILKSIIDMREGKKIPDSVNTSYKNSFEAVEDYNFDKALAISMEYVNKYKMQNNIGCELFDTTLRIACDLVHENKNNNNEANNGEADLEVEATFVNVVASLMRQDVDMAFKVLKSYMRLNDKVKYEGLIIDLIRLSLLQGDFSFVRPISVLSLVIKDKYVFDIDDAVQRFYLSIDQEQFNQSEIYLDILEKMNIDNKDLINGLRKTLDSVKGIDNNNPTVENITDNNSIVTKESEPSDKDKIEEKQSTNSDQISVKPVETKPIEVSPKNEKMENKYQRLARVSHEHLVENKGILLSKVMSKKDLNAFRVELEAYKDIKSFVINIDGADRLVLRYCSYDVVSDQDRKNIAHMKDEARTAGKNKDYATALKYNLQLLETPNPSDFIYSQIGICYLKLKENNLALDYLIVATYFSREKGYLNSLDFGDLIGKMTGKNLFSYDGDLKAQPKMETDEFEYTDVDDTYGIKDIDSIINLAIETDTSVADVCNSLSMTRNQMGRVILFCAKKFYAQRSFDEGDKFIKAFEISEYKGKNNIELCNEIKKNKKFYSNRADGQGPRLVLTLKPGKLTTKV